jgi:hypothetical protein
MPCFASASVCGFNGTAGGNTHSTGALREPVDCAAAPPHTANVSAAMSAAPHFTKAILLTRELTLHESIHPIVDGEPFGNLSRPHS